MNSRGRVRAGLHRAKDWGAAGIPARFFRAPEPAGRSFRSMGTLAGITLGATFADRIEPVTAHIREIFERLELEMSAYRPESAIRRISARAGDEPVAVSEDLYRVLDLGRQFAELTGGAFDITAAPLARLWGFNGAAAPESVPSEEAIPQCVKLVDCKRLVLQEGTAFLSAKGMGLDLGGIAKGYAVDRAYDYCLSAGIRDFLIDFSGSIRACGQPSRGESWRIGVRDPFDRSLIAGKIALYDGMALATSGSYERFVTIGSERFSHVIDPRTGYPVAGTAGVTVVCRDAVTADALSTAFFVLGLDGAQVLLDKFPSAEVLMVQDGHPSELHLTPGFAKYFVSAPGLRMITISAGRG